MNYRHHVCDDHCRALLLTMAHERAWRAHRRQVARAFRGRHPRIRSILGA